MTSSKNSKPNSVLPVSDIPLARKSAAILGEVLAEIVAAVKPGVKFEELEAIAQRELKKRGAQTSFTTVDDYKWATCITKNDGCCHGIPVGKTVEDGDLITIDVGALYQGYHSDTSYTVQAGTKTKDRQKFLEVGKASLEAALQRVTPGNSIYMVSRAMQEVLEKAGYRAVYQLTGHGLGKVLHQEPNIPCYADERSKKDIIEENQLLAIEVMYAEGNPRLVLDKDGWTYKTADGSLTGMFEKTVLVTRGLPEVLTRFPLEKGQAF
ncbi:MAG TPA: type I methionyl aminopeptidase [Candidatus Saccharimonadia bacterium]|nr:type I methionyl aminopeptidase [Candidatus Saccharimonadia bacterium]